ncbi:MAG: protein NO VEIN domain-containing protein, partial [Anaerolineales bacterium]
ALWREISVNDLFAVWVPNHPSGGTFIVGWYTDATVFKDTQNPPSGSRREHKGDLCGYRVSAEAGNCVLLDLDERVFEIPRGKGGLGQANVWYADLPLHAKLRRSVMNYIDTGRFPHSLPDPSVIRPARQPDPYRRERVEETAVALVIKRYENLGYDVDSVEKDNLGWDLEAKFGKRILHLEVKGLSQSNISVELTPNEYNGMRVRKSTFRLCVVTDALSSDPLLSVFAFSPESHSWEDDFGNHLSIIEVMSARAVLSPNSSHYIAG